MRKSTIERTTTETRISLTLSVDGSGQSDIETGCPFLDHMLELLCHHGLFDLTLCCQGDVRVDYHHTVEDIGGVLGRAFFQALGDRSGVRRYGSMLLPMDESLVAAAVDLDGRGTLYFDVPFAAQRIGDFDVELCEEFFLAFTREARLTIHLIRMTGKNTHHMVEAVFKSFGRALREACEIDDRRGDAIPSSKGALL